MLHDLERIDEQHQADDAYQCSELGMLVIAGHPGRSQVKQGVEQGAQSQVHVERGGKVDRHDVLLADDRLPEAGGHYSVGVAWNLANMLVSRGATPTPIFLRKSVIGLRPAARSCSWYSGSCRTCCRTAECWARDR